MRPVFGKFAIFCQFRASVPGFVAFWLFHAFGTSHGIQGVPPQQTGNCYGIIQDHVQLILGHDGWNMLPGALLVYCMASCLSLMCCFTVSRSSGVATHHATARASLPVLSFHLQVMGSIAVLLQWVRICSSACASRLSIVRL